MPICCSLPVHCIYLAAARLPIRTGRMIVVKARLHRQFDLGVDIRLSQFICRLYLVGI